MASLYIFVLLYFTICEVSGYSVKCPPGYSLTENLRQCYRQTGLSYKPGHPFLNVRRVAKFCSTPQTSSPAQCISRAWSPCNDRWSLTERREFQEEMATVTPAFKYLCSQASGLKKNADCIESIRTELEECLLSAHTEADKVRVSLESSGNISEDQEAYIRKSFGLAAVSCTYATAYRFCHKDVADILGNFIFGIYVSPYKSLD